MAAMFSGNFMISIEREDHQRVGALARPSGSSTSHSSAIHSMRWSKTSSVTPSGLPSSTCLLTAAIRSAGTSPASDRPERTSWISGPSWMPIGQTIAHLLHMVQAS